MKQRLRIKNSFNEIMNNFIPFISIPFYLEESFQSSITTFTSWPKITQTTLNLDFELNRQPECVFLPPKFYLCTITWLFKKILTIWKDVLHRSKIRNFENYLYRFGFWQFKILCNGSSHINDWRNRGPMTSRSWRFWWKSGITWKKIRNAVRICMNKNLIKMSESF